MTIYTKRFWRHIAVTTPHAYYSCYLKNQQQSINAFASTWLKEEKEEERKKKINPNLGGEPYLSDT